MKLICTIRLFAAFLHLEEVGFELRGGLRVLLSESGIEGRLTV